MERTAKDLWYKDAVIYGIDVATFQDSNGDGVGDFPGICQRLDYLSELGITCLWLLPFFPTPNRDNGYDVTNYYEIDPRLGSFDDFLQLVHRAGERGIRIIIDLCDGPYVRSTPVVSSRPPRPPLAVSPVL